MTLSLQRISNESNIGQEKPDSDAVLIANHDD
jgi:hypothetical protein